MSASDSSPHEAQSEQDITANVWQEITADRLVELLQDIRVRKELTTIIQEAVKDVGGGVKTTRRVLVPEDIYSILKEDENRVELIHRCIDNLSEAGDMDLLREFYTGEGGILPARKLTAKKFQYWDGEEWRDDDCGKHIMMVLESNLTRLYMGIRKDPYLKDHQLRDRREKCHARISSFRNDKAMKEMLKKFVEIYKEI